MQMFDSFPRKSSCPTARLSVVAIASLVTASVLLAAAPLRAASYIWAVASGDWSVASNWAGSLPTGGDTAYVVNGGTVNVTTLGETCGALSLGGTAGSGTLQMTGGSLSAASYEYVGDSGTGTFAQSGGSNNVGNGTLCLGYNIGSSGAYNLSGNGQLSAFNENVGFSGAGTFTQSGGTSTVTSALSLSASGIYNLTGGALLVPGIQGTGVFNLGGGTLVANAALSTAQPMTLTGSGGNGNINADGYPITLSGLLSGTGGLSKWGAGTLTLTASDSYTGTTAVNNGILKLDFSAVGAPGSNIINNISNSSTLALGGGNAIVIMDYGSLNIASAIVNNASGATLTLSGPGITTLSGTNTYTGATWINNGPTLRVGNGGNSGTLGSGNVTNNGTLIFSRSDAGLSGSDNTYTAGTLVAAGTLDVTNSDALPGGTGLTVGAGGTVIFDPAPAGAPMVATRSLAAVPEPAALELMAAALWSAVIYHRFRCRCKR